MLYPFAAAAVAINLFMFGLLARLADWPSISPWTAIALSAPLGVPATWWCARRLRALMDEADGYE